MTLLRCARVLLTCCFATALLCGSAAMADEPAANQDEYEGITEPVIPPGQEDLLADMAGRGATLPADCTMASGEIDGRQVKVTYACPSGSVVVEMVHPSTLGGDAPHSEQFALRVASGSAPPELLPALLERIREREKPFVWRLPTQRSPNALLLRGAIAAVAAAVLLWIWRRRRTRRDGPTAPAA